MAFRKLFDNPLFKNRAPLILRWGDDQLKPLVDRLSPLMPGLSDQMQLAVASVARSIVTEKTITGRGVHYARAKDPYRRPKRYRDGDPRFTWYYVTGAMDALRRAGLIEHVVGEWWPYTKGFESVAWATDELMTLVEPLVDVWEHRGISNRVETIVLRDRADKTEVDYTETVDTVTMREQVRILNDHLAQLELRHRGQKVDIPIGRRIFNASFDRGGRFYCHGTSFQNMPAGQRRELEWIIDGTAHPTVEIDYSNLHIRMAYSEAGRKIPHGDQYTIDGFDRGLVKLAVNTLFNASTTNSGILAIAEELHNDPKLRAVNGITSSDRSPCRALAEQVVAAIQHKHRRIKSYFGSDCGARFQRQDSDMAIEVMTRMIRRTGRCPLPMHDSFLVPEIDADILSQTMIEVARDYRLHLDLKDSGGNRSNLPSDPLPSSHPLFPSFLSSFTTSLSSFPTSLSYYPSSPPPLLFLPSSLFTMEVTTSDLRRSGRRIWRKKVSFMAREAIADTLGTAIGAFGPRKRPQCHGPPAL
jgi:hypothetical protein